MLVGWLVGWLVAAPLLGWGSVFAVKDTAPTPCFSPLVFPSHVHPHLSFHFSEHQHTLCVTLCECTRHTGLGVVRRIQLAPASPPVLSGTTEAALSGGPTARGSGVERLRAAVLFGSGQVNVYELDAVGRIRPGGLVNASAASKLGPVKDIGWLPLPS